MAYPPAEAVVTMVSLAIVWVVSTGRGVQVVTQEPLGHELVRVGVHVRVSTKRNEIGEDDGAARDMAIVKVVFRGCMGHAQAPDRRISMHLLDERSKVRQSGFILPSGQPCRTYNAVKFYGSFISTRKLC